MLIISYFFLSLCVVFVYMNTVRFIVTHFALLFSMSCDFMYMSRLIARGSDELKSW